MVACTVSVHPLLGPHVRLQEEPERHVWQAEVGTAAQPWLGDHQIRNVAVLPGAAYCEMALAAARAVLGEAAEVRDIRFEQALLLDEQTTVGASASLSSPGVVDFTVETNQGGEQARQASAVLHAADDERPPAHDMSALLAAHPRSEDGAEVRKRLDQRGCSVRSGVHRSGRGAHRRGGNRHRAGRGRAYPAKSARNKVLTACTRRCWMPVFSPLRLIRTSRPWAKMCWRLPLGVRRLRAYGSARNARYCYTRVTKADTTGIEADIDVLDEHGAVLLTVQGLRLGTGVSESGHNDRVLAERLLTIEWRQRELPEVEPGRRRKLAADQHHRHRRTCWPPR